MAANQRRDEYLEAFAPEKQEGEDVEDGEHVSQGEAAANAKADGSESNRSQDPAAADSGVNTVGRTATARRRGSTAPPVSSGEKEKEHATAAIGNAAGDGLGRQAERDLMEKQLDKELMDIYHEMTECVAFHDLIQ